MKAGSLKAIFELLTFEEALDQKGFKVRRSGFTKKHFKSFQSLRKNLLKHVEVGIEREDQTPEWIKLEDYSQEKGKIIFERFLDADISLSEAEKSLMKEVIDEATELPIMNDEEYADFITLIGFDPVQ